MEILLELKKAIRIVDEYGGEAYILRDGAPFDAPSALLGVQVGNIRKSGYPRPLLIHNRTSGGCGYSIDERDMKVYNRWRSDRRERGIDPDRPTREEEEKERWPLVRGEMA